MVNSRLDLGLFFCKGCGVGFFCGWMQEKRGQSFLGGCDLHRNYGVAVILLSFLCNYDNLTVKLHQEKRSYPDEGWILLADSKLEVNQEWMLILKHLKAKSIMSMM